MMFTRRLGKFNATKAVYKGHLYHSKKERDYAILLDGKVQAGDLKEWRRQVPVRLEVNGKLICTHIRDFVEVEPDGTEVWTEVKGKWTAEARLKEKLFEAGIALQS
jgi:hypothetical protein